MKCEKCGKYEATCHYSSNINGKVTEQHLCGDCAGETEWARGMFADADRMFEDAFDGFGGFFAAPRRVLSPWGFGYAMPAFMMPRMALMERRAAQPRAEAAKPEAAEAQAPAQAEAQPVQADPEIAKRREINELREQMRAAAEAEEFEKAAELRDRLREMEK